jgi:hypothetical protein
MAACAAMTVGAMVSGPLRSGPFVRRMGSADQEQWALERRGERAQAGAGRD